MMLFRLFQNFFFLLLSFAFPVLLFAGNVINVFVTVPPQAYFVKRIGAEHVSVSVMVQPGHGPETYEPTLKQMAKMAKTDLFFLLGLPSELRLAKALKDQYPLMRLIYCCEGVAQLPGADPDNAEDQDPHVWTSPRQAIHMVRSMYLALVNFSPALQLELEKNYLQLVDDLISMDKKIESSLAGAKRRIMIVSHPSWGYFARDYNLIQLPLAAHDYHMHTAELVDLIKLAKQKEVRFIFAQPQFDQDMAHIVAREIGAEVIMLNPLAEDYLVNMDYMRSMILKALR